MEDLDLKTWCLQNDRLDIVNQYSEKNIKKIDELRLNSRDKVIWVLPYFDVGLNKEFIFEWEARVDHRISGVSNCPFLSGKKVWTGFNDLKTREPELAKEWHPSKNNKLTPSMFSKSSSKTVWWKCKEGHEWQATISSRSSGHGCPYCSGRMAIQGVNDLATTNPELLDEWDYERNKVLPTEISRGSSKKIFWICKKGHSYTLTISNKLKGISCGVCSNHQVMKGVNDFLTWCKENDGQKYLAEWDYSKNGEPDIFTASSKKKVWWKCTKGHEWQTQIYCRTIMKTNCPYCSNSKVLTGYNDLKTWCINNNKMHLIQEWSNNNSKNMDEYATNSNSKVSWVCKEGHEWKASIYSRTSLNTNCPYCSGRNAVVGKNDLKTRRPDIAKEWHPTLNGSLKPEDFTEFSTRKIWWLCRKGHEYQATIGNRTGVSHTNCPICSKEMKTSFPEQAILFYVKRHFSDAVGSDMHIGIELDIYIPSRDVAIEYDGMLWHRSKRTAVDIKKNILCMDNNILLIRVREKGCFYMEETPNVKILNLEKNNNVLALENAIESVLEMLGVKCRENDINIDRDRPKIMEQYIIGEKENSLASLFPEISKEWHPTLNGSLKPSMIASKSGKKVWWKCEKGHEYQASVDSRTYKKYGCPYCSKHRVVEGSNDLKTWCSENNKISLLNEWDYVKNKDFLPETISAFSNKKVWWKCEKSHEWQTIVQNRTKHKTGCPFCSNKKLLEGYNDLSSWCYINKKESILEEWCSDNELKPNQVLYGSHKKIKWKCKKGHEWVTSVYSRTMDQSGCIKCQYKRVINVETKEVFESATAAQEKYSISKTAILRCCKGEKSYNTAGGYHWKFAED